MRLLEKETEIRNGILSAEKKHLVGKVSEHGHRFFEMEYIISGSGTYIINGKPYEICEKRIFLMSPSDFHSIVDCDTTIINVMFSCDLCDTNSIYRLFAPGSSCVVDFSLEDGIFIEKLFLEIAQSDEMDYMIQFLRAALYKCSSLVGEYKNQAYEHNHSYVQEAIVYILENFSDGITLNDTANHIRLAPAYLSDLFSSETGTNFKSYLDNIRFEYAIKLLRFTSVPILQVCSEAGFSDYTNFSRRFKKRYGVSPGDLRKQYNKK